MKKKYNVLIVGFGYWGPILARNFHSDINFKIYKGYSQSILPKLYELGNKYDLIYVDASHQSDYAGTPLRPPP